MNVGTGLSAYGPITYKTPVTQTGNFSVATTDYFIICNGAAQITVTLPTANTSTGRVLNIKTIAAQSVISSANNVVPLAGGAASNSILTNTAGKWAVIQSNGTNWEILMAN